MAGIILKMGAVRHEQGARPENPLADKAVRPLLGPPVTAVTAKQILKPVISINPNVMGMSFQPTPTLKKR